MTDNSATKGLFKVNSLIAILVALIMTFAILIRVNLYFILLVFLLFLYLSFQGLFKKALTKFIVF